MDDVVVRSSEGDEGAKGDDEARHGGRRSERGRESERGACCVDDESLRAEPLRKELVEERRASARGMQEEAGGVSLPCIILVTHNSSQTTQI